MLLYYIIYICIEGITVVCSDPLLPPMLKVVLMALFRATTLIVCRHKHCTGQATGHYFSLQCFWCPRALLCLKVPRLHPFVLVVTVVLSCRWLWCIGRMILTGENRSTRKEIQPIATLSTTNWTWTGRERPLKNHPKCCVVWSLKLHQTYYSPVHTSTLHTPNGNFMFMWPCIITNLFIIKPTRCTNFTNLFWHETLHVSDSYSVHHQKFIHCTLSNGICHTDSFRAGPAGPARRLSTNLYVIHHCWVCDE